MAAAVTSPASDPRPAGNNDAPTEHVPTNDARWERVLALPCGVSVDLAVPKLKVADFVGLHPGSVVETGWGIARDVPLFVNGVLIGWGELEGAGTRLAIRVTEFA
ncbi:MAG TPA: FliM/FliN family flagellar motor C-terminal domain-containing protein [Dongiaceae bacterium]|nr:FliM/FliN family flagellar motor C-terminal domain-containing protein [Dongiaceae bacterium]